MGDSKVRRRGKAKNPAFTLASLFGLAKGIGLTPDEAKEMAYSLIGKDSLKDFTKSEINEVCFALMEHKDGQKQRPDKATEQQLYRIRELEILLGWDCDYRRLAGFVSKVYHVSSVLWLSCAQAGKLIESLKAMVEREQERNVK